MTPSKFFWICSSAALGFAFAGCTGFQARSYSLSNRNNDFMVEYCQSGKQKKSFKTTVFYFVPALEPNLALDKANQKNKKIAEQKNDTLKKLFYTLGNSAMSEPVGNMGEEPNWYLLVSEDEKDVLNNIKVEDSNTKHRLFTFIVKILNQNKIIIYQSNQHSRRMGYDIGYSTDLSNLMDEFTILTPKNVIEEITGTEFNRQYPYSSIVLNESGEIDISKAISRKSDLWKAYIYKFTSIKDASEDNSQKSTIELSLDLNVFCKYGRKVSDLQSK